MDPEQRVRAYQVDRREYMHFKGGNSWCKGNGVQLECLGLGVGGKSQGKAGQRRALESLQKGVLFDK